VNRPPHYINTLGFLGGIIDAKETAEDASVRILKEKGNLTKVYLEQLATFSAINRDKRNRVVSVAYMGLVRPEVAAVYEHSDAKFVPIAKLHALAYDHDEMMLTALTRLRGKIAYTTVIQHLLPKYFTLSELQGAYEAILQKDLDKRNFRKKILALDIVKETGKMQEGVKNRPAALYEFSSHKVKELTLIA
jgi:8-oxo-dGTP diphosphatase